MHKLLARQLKRFQLKLSGDVHLSAESWQAFLQTLSDSYEQADANREMVERSLNLMSSELTLRNRELQEHVNQLQKHHELIHFQAHHDALTNLPNRALLNDRLEHAITGARRNNSLVAILFIDLDHFKKINDTCGHQHGDELLCAVSDRLKACKREHDTLARFGGDEFIVLLENLRTFSGATAVGMRMLEAVTQPYWIQQQQFHISASIGVSIFPRDDTIAQELIRKADIAMYHAKERGRNNLQYFSQPLERLALYQISLEQRLRQAIEFSEFSLVYQPKISLPDERVSGLEALLRWYPKGKPAVSPVDFIPVAEKTGLIKQLGEWVLQQACQQIRCWLDLGFRDINVSVNVSSKELLETNMSSRLRNLLDRHAIPPEMLQIEITETALMENLAAAKQTLNEIRSLGVSIALDDFGTGYSSLSYLQNLPIDYLKIDKAFVQNLHGDEQSTAIALSIIALGHNLQLKVVAEGAETREAVDILSQQKCDLIQGYYFYKPLCADEVTELLQKQFEQ